MAEQVTCPVIKDILSENECLENFGGLGVNVYVFIKSDLAAPLEPEAGKNTYATLSAASFKTGKGLSGWRSGSYLGKLGIPKGL